MNDDLVSIIMPSYNTANFIDKTIKSVIDQTYTKWELIIVDDCSTDNTQKIVESVNDSRIIYIENERNSGAAISRNIALSKASGKWIAFLDSDDLWEKTKLEHQISFMKDKKIHFSYTNYIEIDEEGKEIGQFVTGPKIINRIRMLCFNYMGCLTVMYDREYIGLVQIENLSKRNDYALWVKVSKKANAYLLNETLAKYRVRKTGSIMNRNAGTLNRLKYNYFLWKEGEQHSFPIALLLTGINLIFGFLKSRIYKKKYEVPS